jgi:hypothetical protein
MVSTATMMAMISLWDSRTILNMDFRWSMMAWTECVFPSFANGKLLRWKVTVPSEYCTMLSIHGLLYRRLRQRRPVCGNGESALTMSSLRPYERKAFYNGTLHLNFPSKPQAYLTCTGSDWKFPDPKENRAALCRVQARCT